MLGLFAQAAPAAAYPWLIGHGYASCAACHVDPSGAGQLTAYGRGMSDLLVRWHVDPAEVESGEPSPTSGFLFGLLTLPDWLNVSGNLRGGGVITGSSPFTSTSNYGVWPLLMAADVTATLTFDPFIAHVSVGYGLRNVGPAAVISQDAGPNNALVSREHWVGLRFLDNSLVFRAGRIPLPFGLRNNEHTSLVRRATRTDINTDQQHGIAVAYANDIVRTEVMGIAGNYQVRPDAVRERGYAGYVEITPLTRFAIGASSLLTYAQRDIDRGVPTLRQAHGVFARYAPLESVVFLFEGDALIATVDNNKTELGGVGWLQLDYAPIPGLHFMPALETSYTNDGKSKLPSLGAWGGVAWYALPHAELRFDAIYREAFPASGTAQGSLAGVLQLHLFL